MRSRARQLAAALLLVAATVLLGGCFTIRNAQLVQLDVTGDVEVRTEVCLRSTQPQDPSPGLSCRSAGADPTSKDATSFDFQLFYAYMVSEQAVAPASVTATGALDGVVFTQSPEFAARLAEQPGQTARYDMKWVAFASPRIPKIENVTTPLDAIIAPRFGAAAISGSFNARVVHGWRPVTDDPGMDAGRPVVCGDTTDGSGRPTTFTDCGSNDPSVGPPENNYFPRKNGGTDDNIYTYPVMSLPVASAVVSSPLLGGAIDAGQATTLQFGFSSRAALGAPPTVPVAAGTTIPGGVAVANTTALPLAAGAGTLLVEVFAPPGTPTGIYQVGVTVGTGTGLRSALAPISVTAVGQTGTPKFDNNTLLTGKQHAAQLRRLLDKKKVGERLRKKSKTTISYAHQEGVTVKLKLRTSGKKGRTVAQGTSRSAGGGLDKITLKRTKYGSKKLRRGSRFKGRMVITLSGAQEDLVNEQISLRTKPKRKTSSKK